MRIGHGITPQIGQDIFDERQDFAVIADGRVIQELLQDSDALTQEVVYLIAEALRRLPGLKGYEAVEDVFHFFIALFQDSVLLGQFPVQAMKGRHIGCRNLPARLAAEADRAPLQEPGLAGIPTKEQIPALAFHGKAGAIATKGQEMPEDVGIADDCADELFHDGIHGKVDQHRLALFPADEDSFIKAVYGRLDGAGRQTLLILVVSPWKDADQAPGQTNQGQDQRAWQPVIENGQQQDRRCQNPEAACLTVMDPVHSTCRPGQGGAVAPEIRRFVVDDTIQAVRVDFIQNSRHRHKQEQAAPFQAFAAELAKLGLRHEVIIEDAVS